MVKKLTLCDVALTLTQYQEKKEHIVEPPLPKQIHFLVVVLYHNLKTGSNKNVRQTCLVI